MSASSPLLNSSHMNPSAKIPTTPPSALAKTLLSFIGCTRALFGLGVLLAPSLALKLVGIHASLSPEASITARMFGVREIIVGEWLLLAERSAAAKRGTGAQDAGSEEVKRAIWLNVATDSLDLVALGLAFAQGLLGGVTAAKMTVTAVLYAAMGAEAGWLWK